MLSRRYKPTMTSTTAKVKEEAEAPQDYKYKWSADAKPELSADEFIAKVGTDL